MRLPGLSLVVSLVVVLVAAACAPVSKLPEVDAEAAAIEAEKQRELILETVFEQRARVHGIAYALFERNAELCEGSTVPAIGVTLGNRFSFGEDYEETLARVYGFTDAVNVASVAAGSPASLAGLSLGDAIVSINDWPVPRGEKAPKTASVKLTEFMTEDPTLRLLVDGEDGRREVEVTARQTCDYRFGIVQQDDVNAFADGKGIAVTSGMIRFADSDVELATVIGHEMAHNLMGHVTKQRGNAAIGLIFDLLFAGFGVNTQGAFSRLAAQAYSKEFEAEADYVGLYLMARAGFDVEETPNFWRRMAIAHPGSVKRAMAASHPPTPDRFLALEETVAEIDAKREAGRPLLPEAGYEPPARPEPESRAPFGP